MGSQHVANADNDIRFASIAFSLIDTRNQTSVAFETAKYHQEWTLCKPFCKPKYPREILAYPGHPEFRQRIGFIEWNKFNADFHHQMYVHGLPCDSFNSCFIAAIPKYRALYKVIAYYNKVLFHPMLIDAQVFVNRILADPDDDFPTLEYYVSFLMAKSELEFLEIPRPVQNHSSGYRYSFSCCYTYNYELPEYIQNLPISVPSQSPEFHTMYVHTDEYLQQEPMPIENSYCCGYDAISQYRIQMRPIAYSVEDIEDHLARNAQEQRDSLQPHQLTLSEIVEGNVTPAVVEIVPSCNRSSSLSTSTQDSNHNAIDLPPVYTQVETVEPIERI